MLRVESRDREVRSLNPAIFTVSGLLCICYILPSNNVKLLAVAYFTTTAAVLEYRNRAIQTPVVQTPAIEAPQADRNEANERDHHCLEIL